VNAGFKSVIAWFNAWLAFVYPEVCQLCRKARATPAEGFVCTGCREQVQFIERPFCERCGYPYHGAINTTFECTNCHMLDFSFRYARSAVVAKDAVLDVIHRYKYNRALWFEPFLVDLFAVRARTDLRAADWDWIVPVPLHPTKEREREFNQAERMGSGLSQATHIPLNSRLLRRVQRTRTQTRLSREERLANVANAFTLHGGASLAGARIVLVDDVFTTGATTNACARVLRTAGATDVCVWTVARGI
jgi:ComF family protein